MTHNQTVTGEGNAPRETEHKRTIEQWFAYQDRTIAEIHALNMELKSVKAQRDELVATLSFIAQRANFMLVRNPSDNQAEYIRQQANAAIANAEGSK